MADTPTEVRAIAEILWQFHNDRLKDPNIKEMKPYIDPILQLLIKERIALLNSLKTKKVKGADLVEMKWIDQEIQELKEGIK